MIELVIVVVGGIISIIAMVIPVVYFIKLTTEDTTKDQLYEEGRKMLEYAKKIQKYCNKHEKHDYKSCVFYKGGWCAFGFVCNGVSENWFLPEPEDLEEGLEK